jgi:hypothetical protein
MGVQATANRRACRLPAPHFLIHALSRYGVAEVFGFAIGNFIAHSSQT